MAITAFTGVPGSGKSYALVEQVIVPAVMAGRRVLTNIEGVDPDRVAAYCAAKSGAPVGSVVLFDGQRATQPGFFPTESIPDTDTVLKAGDYLVVDEWRLYWPRRGKMPSPDLEPFLRWHRHLVADNGQSTDVAIGTQMATDVSQDFRGLIERSYKFRKLKALGRPKNYAWDVFEGHLQPKGGHYSQGLGSYKPEVFALYKSYAAVGGAENNNDKRVSIFGKGFYALAALCVVLLSFGGWGTWKFFRSSAAPAAAASGQPVAAVPASGAVAPGAPSVGARSGWRIVGQVLGDYGARVVVMDDSGATRILPPGDFRFEYDRPVSGVLDGKTIVAEDRAPVAKGGIMGPPPPLPGSVQ